MPATINPTTGDPCERVFAAFARPHCEMCDDTGTITIDDDDGHDVFRAELVPCPECEAGDDAAWWAEMDAAVRYHQDVGEWRAVGLAPTDWSDDDFIPF